jgi:hypothetical protein
MERIAYMKNTNGIVLPLAGLALAALACQALSSSPADTNVVTSTPFTPPSTDAPSLPTATQPPASGNSDILFRDDFSGGRNQWGTGTDADSSVEYFEETLNFQIFTTNYSVWTAPNDSDYENVHMEVTVINNGTDSNTAFGFICNQQQFLDDSYYYFVVTPAGEYAIAKAAIGFDDVFLTNNDAWGSSDLIAKDAASYRIGADCANSTLTLYVDGQEVASVDDTSYTSGGFALFAWSDEDAALTNVSFDDFVMTQLP